MSSMADTPRGANGYPDDSEDSAGTDYKPHSYVGGTSMDDQATRQHLYDNPRTKMCFFYKDGEVHQKALKLVINQRRYRDLDILKNELTDKVPDLPFGVRSIYTPHGRTLITSLEDLEDSGNYICSTHRNKARGVDLARVTKRTPWQQGHPSSKHLLNRYLRHRDGKTQKPPPRKKAWGQQPQDSEHLYGTRVPKKITVLKNGEPHVRHTILLNRKTSQSFEQVIEDMCQIFQMQIRKLYTIEGRPVHSLSSIFNGPDIYVVTGGDRYKPMTAMSEPTPLPKRRRFEAQPTHKRNREKKDTSSHPKGEWKVWVTTNELPSAGTQAHVSITVYGNKGNSGPLPLTFGDSEIGTFQAGSVDEFDICAGNIGDIYKIRIGHDNSGEFPGWFCDEVRMEDINTGEELKFRCQRWMSRDEDDHEICRELPVIRNREPVRPVMDYDIQVVTGDLWNAGTEANVYVTIYGKYGDTGVRQLYHPSLRKFHMGQSDHFHLEAVHLGQLQRVIVGHDGVGVGSGWFLDKIIIKESVSSTKEAVFLCRRWLDEGEDDGKIVRELKPLEEYNRDLIEKEMFEPERWKYQTGNQIILYPQSTQRPLRIRPDASIDCTVDHHDPDAVFVVNSTKRDLVKVFQSKKNHHYHLAIENNKLLGQGKGGSFSEFKIKVQEDRSVCFESTKYIGQHLAILSNGRPGNPRGQATDPSKQFYVYCKGTLRQEGIILFHSSAAHGQVMNINEDNSLSATGRNNKLAHFRVHKVDRGGVRMFESMAYPRQFLRIKDGQVDVNGKGGTYCHFHVDRVKEKGYLTLESVSSRGIFVGMSPEGKIRPTVNTGDKNVRLFPEVIHFGRSVTPEPEKKTPRKVRRRSPSPVTPQPRKRSPIRSASSTLSSAESFYEDGEWKLWVTSAESAENADVAVVVYGDQGSSGRIILGKAKDSELFRAGNVDEFKVNLESVGTIYKIRMELQAASRKRKPSWKVKEVKMQAMKSRETLRFKFNRWMSELHDDGDIMRELPAVRPKKRTIPVVHYQVYVYTGSQPSADTEANVCIVLFGERGDTGRRFLLRSDQENKFLEGQCDRFELEAVSLGRLTRCVISHDGEGSGEGWFCEKVVVKETERASEEYIFPCNKWLDAGIDDKKIERVLKVSDGLDDDDSWIPEEHHAIPITRKPKSPKPKEEKPKDGEWIIWVTTGRHDNMSTKTHVTLVGYGSRDKSEELPLGDENDGLLFQKSQTDEFKVNLGSSRKIGELYKIRIGRNDLDTSSGWFIEKIKMKNLFSDEVLNFRVNRWLSRGEEDCDVWRELPVVRPGKKPLPIFMYRVEVYTGNQPGADTEASVHIQLIGSRGDSGKRLLYKSLNNDLKFCEGAIDIFELECVSLREVKQVLIGHEDSSKGAGWFCEKVIVREGEEADSKVFFFPCGQWLDSGMDDSKIERILDAAEPPKQSRGEYKVWVKTKKDSKPPKGSKVTLTVYAERGKSKDVELGQEKGSFEAGREDEFDIAIGDLGQPYKIRIGRKENDRWEGWHLLSVRMLDVDTREEFLFKFDRWMHRSKDDFDIVRELPVTKEGSESLPVKKYEVKVYTGDRWAAGTDADIFVTIYGSKGDSGQRRLFRSSEEHERMFQRNQVDTFTIEAVSLEDLRKITLKHASQGFGAGVFVEKVVVREAESNEKDKEVVFPCNRWLDDHMDDQATHRDLFPSVIQPQGTPSYKAPKKGTKTQGVWSVMVKTGDVLNAGTHAVVHITACGSKGDSAKLELRGNSADDFDRDKKSEFEVNFGDIGEIRKIRIEHDNSNDFPDWFLQRICIEDKHTKESSAFEVNRWLSTDEDDRQLCREMAVCRGEDVPPVISYLVMVFTSDGQDCSTEANVHVLLSGHHGNTGWRPLTESRVHNIKWLSKQMDLFTFDAVHLGDLQSIKLKHDGTDQDSAWNVNKVIVKETEHALMEYVFACDTWIQPADDGKENIAEFFCTGQTLASPLPEKESILLKSESESKGHWTVWLHTHPESDPAFKADVSIVVCGTDDSTQVIPLKDEEGDEFDARSPNKIVKSRKTAAQPPAVHFSPGSKDEFKIKAGKIGELIKIRLLVDPSGQNPSLLLSRLKMKDTDTQQEFHFTVDRWLKAKSSDSKEDIVLELPAVRPDVAPMSDVTYHVSVKTGSEFGSDTKADVFCLIKGEFGDTGRRPLLRSDKGADSFTLSQVDTYDLHAIDIGKVKQLTLGHTKYGRGRGWFCERATLRIGNSTEESVFPCHKWFDSALDDHLMERVLRPIGILPSPTNESPSGAYKAFAKTGAHSNYNTNSNNNNSIDNDNIDWLNCNNNNGSDPDRRQICVYAYGEKGSAGPIPLDNGDEDLFAPGKEEEFDLNVGDIGKIYKLRVCDGNSSYNRQPWILSELMLQDVHSKQTLKFDFSVFMGEIEGDHCKEIPALHADGDMLPVLTYGISILIGSNEETEKEKKENKKKKKKKGAEKEKHDISLCLHGTRGDSGFRQMIEIRKDLAEFTLGEAKEFSIRAVDLDKVHKVTVRKHSSNDLDLKEVAVKCGEFASMQDVFAYDQVIKGDVDVEIVLSEKREVKKSEEEEEEAVWPISRGRWEVTVITGKDKQDCDLVPATPALILIGSKGQSSPCPLKAQDASLQPFQPGATDKFRIRIKAEEVGEIKKVKVGFLKGRQNTRWFLQKIHFDDLDSGDSFSIEHGDWIDHESGWTLLLVKWPGMDDLSATAVHYIDVHTSSLPNASTDEPVFVQLHGKNKNKKVMSERIFLTKSNCTSSNSKLFMEGQSDQFMIESIEFETVERVFMGHESKVKGAGWHLDKVIVRNGKRPDVGHEFPCQRWFDVSQDDASTQRFLMPAESKALTPVPAVIPDVPPEEEEKEEGIWTVQVTTSKVKDAEHSAQVVMVIYGTKGKSAEFVLDNGQKNYQKGETDKFEVKIAEEVGQVYKIRIGFVNGTALNTKWQLDKVILRCEDTTDNYEFVYNEWVTLNAESDSWTEIAVKSDREQLEVKSYEVLVYTGMHANAGTDASVCAEIIGTRGDTGRRKLLKSSEEGKMFLQGKVDVFSIRAVDLEEIAKVVISHDAKVKGDGWFLDRVVVREKGKEFLFPCERWLDAGEDDGETERVLELKEKDEPPEYLWKISTRTSKGKTKTDTFQVFIVIYGKKGKTEQLELDNGKKGNFQPSKTDLFQVKTSKDVGEVYKIRVGFLETKNGLVWNLDEIELQNIVCGEKYKFSHKAVMQCTALSDGQIEIPVTLKDGILPVLCYEVLVHTADCEHAETQAEAFVEIQGERGDTGRRKLMKQGEKFTRGRVDAFEFLAVDLLTLTKVTIGHDCQERGAGWCVHKVQVKCNQGEFHFPCNRWLDAGQDDGMVERTLDVEESDQTWRVSVKSGLYSDNPKSSDGSSPANQGVPPAPPTGDLVMFIYGEEGNTEELHLTASNPPQYKPNSCDEFEVKFPRTLNLGALYKIRIGFKEGTTDDQNWNVVSVELQAENSERVHTFNLNGWLKLDHENDGWREIPVTLPTPLKEEKKTKKNGKKAEKKENIVLPLPVHNYQVEVHTGKMEDAGTRSGVYLKMQGKHGDSGSRKLLKALNTRPDVQFASGEISLFEVEAVDLQDLTSITVGHDNTDGGWNLHKIVVKPSAEAEQRYVFMCHRWFDVEKEDGLIERTIDVLKPGEEWKIRVSTGKEEGSSCSGPLLIVLYGDKGVSEIIEVGTDETVFENKRSQDFDVTVYPEKTTDEIGNPYKIRLGLKEREGDCMWHFDQLVAERVSDAEEFHFKGDVWIRLGEDSDSWREFPSWYENPDKVLPVIAYQIEVFTADKTGAGTDANVYVQLFGERGDTGKRKMLKSREEGNKFESGKKDIFEIEAVDLMELTRVVVGHDGKGFGAGWYLDKVAVKPGEDAENKYVFNCGRWLDKGEDDAKIERELEITQVIDGDEDPPEEGDWRILIMTSDKDNAGTDAQVTLTVFGVNGDSGPLPLGEPGGGFFEAAATDQFDIWLEPEEVGKVRKIRIEHDNRHEGCGWHLNKILFEDKFVGTLVEFPVDRWLDEDEDDGDIVREIPAVYSGEDPLPITKYQVKTVTGDKRGAGTDAKVYVNLIGKNGDSGKRPLNISQRSSNKFESGKTDEFSLEAVDLGEIEKLVVNHNGTGVGSGWYLEEVIVVCEGEEMVFPCHNWLDEREGDGLLERELVKGKK